MTSELDRTATELVKLWVASVRATVPGGLVPVPFSARAVDLIRDQPDAVVVKVGHVNLFGFRFAVPGSAPVVFMAEVPVLPAEALVPTAHLIRGVLGARVLEVY